MKERSHNYARRLHLSFLLILMIPVVVTLALYVYVMRQANEQSDRLHESLLAKVQADVDACFLSARSVASRLYIDSDVRTLAYVDGEMQSVHAMPQLRLYQELNSLTLSNKSLGSIFIYYPRAHKIISTNGNMDLSMYHSLYYDENCLSEEALEMLLSGEHRYDVCFLKAKGQVTQMVMLHSLPSNNGMSATIGTIFAADVLRTQTALNGFSDTETRLYLRSGSGGLYSPADSFIEAEKIPETELNGGTARFRGENVRTTVHASSQVNVQYLMVTPERLIHEDVRKLHFVIVLGLLLSILSGLLLSKHLTTRNFDPVERLLRTIRSGTDENTVGAGVDELVWANREVEQLYLRSVNNEQLLRDSHRRMRDYCLLQLLTTGRAERPESYGIRLSAPAYGIVVLKVLGTAELKETESTLRTSIIRNLFEENIRAQYGAELLEWGDAVVALVSLPDSDPIHLSVLRREGEKLQTTVETTLHFSCAVFIGPMADGTAEIPSAYRSACELEDYRPLLDTNLISAEEIINLGSQYDFTLDDEEKLKSAVIIGDGAASEALMRDIFERNRKAKISVNLYWCLVYAMASVLLRGANNGGIRDAVKDLRLREVLTEHKPGTDLENAFIGIIREICAEITRSRTDTDGERSFCADLEAFIQAHFTDPDLNISFVSHHFDLTPAYLSTRYKRQTGRSLLDFINTSRLNYAEKLLESGVTVAEAAERSGFRESGNLIRAFKKKKGITPGQVRQQNG